MGHLDYAGCAGAGCIIATKYLRDVVVVIKITDYKGQYIIALLFLPPVIRSDK